MKIQQPAQEKEVCDHCQREGVLETCLVCGARFCLLCECYLPGCMVPPYVCKPCDKRKDVQRLVTHYGDRIRELCGVRDKQLRTLGAKPTTV